MTTLVYLSSTCKERVAEVDLSKVASSDLIRTILKEYQKNSYLNATNAKKLYVKIGEHLTLLDKLDNLTNADEIVYSDVIAPQNAAEFERKNGIVYFFHSSEKPHLNYPHVHARYGEDTISISLRDFTVIGSFSSKKKQKEAVEYVKNKQNLTRLKAEWNRIMEASYQEDAMVQVLYCMKIAKPRWAKSLRDGTAQFGSVESYIQKAQKDHNDEQGDAFEGVFARVGRFSNELINCMKKFGNDLEIIPDGEYCLLRRKSIRKACVFCMYGLTPQDFLPIGELYYIDGVKVCDFQHTVSQKMFEGFLDDKEKAASVCASIGHLNEAISKGASDVGYTIRRQELKYDLDFTREFMIAGIEPGSPYEELFHKQKRFSYQHELRSLLSNVDCPPSQDGIPIQYKKLEKDSLFYDESNDVGMIIQMTCSIKEKTS